MIWLMLAPSVDRLPKLWRRPKRDKRISACSRSSSSFWFYRY